MTALALATLVGLSTACAPQVAPATLLSLARAESAFDPLSIGVNSRPRRTLHPATRDAAIAAAEALQVRKQSFDLGLTQINVGNLQRLGLTLETAFDPCRNLAGGAKVLAAAYQAARRDEADEQTALRAALSTYNTGDPQRGLRNGYVARVLRAADQVAPKLVPALSVEPAVTAAASSPPVLLRAGVSAAAASPLDVFARPAKALVDWTAIPPGAARPPALPVPSPAGDPS